MDLIAKLNKTPPFLCRLLARGGSGKSCAALTLDEIASRASLSPSTVSKLSKRRSWRNETLRVINDFAAACGVDLLHPRRHLDFIKRKKRSHIKKRGSYFKQMIKEIKP